ncbi:host attachment protein [Devosia sp. 1566]|uniref:baeRF12 domain-containing protein n=1 Tax=Devosia sp. 1566 TaxID=2499144 RepID=UPI000FDB38F4|nr:host attachment protein [Devosia sp. 1566]
MQLPHGTIVAVADGEKLNLFRNTGDEGRLQLAAEPKASVDASGSGSGGHQSSSSNPDNGQQAEDGFSAGVVDVLNGMALSGAAKNMVIVAAPRSLGEFRKRYHKSLSAILLGELDKDLTGHSLAEVEAAVGAH